MSQALSETIRTIRVGISGTSDTESYTLAPGLAQYVESVYIEVTNGAAAGVHPVLAISEQAGVVIAKRRQGGTIAAGGSGSATWALRLSGDDTGDTGLTGIFYTIQNVGDFLRIETNGGSGADPIEVDYVLDNGQFHITALDPTRGEFLVDSRFVHLITPGGDFNIHSDGTINLTGDYATFTIVGGEIDTTDNFSVNINTAGKAIYFYDHNGQPIFKIDENGDLHGKTGKSLVFDL